MGTSVATTTGSVYTETCPTKLAEARQNGRFVVFAGSGVSSQTRRPGWDDLVAHLIRNAAGKGMSGARAGALARLHQQSKSVAHTKLVPCVVKELVESQVGSGSYVQCLKDALEPMEADDAGRYHDLLYSLRPTCVVTTNYDLCFENRAEEEGDKWPALVVEDEPVDASAGLRTSCVYHLHGVTSQEQSMILGLDEYTRLYRRKQNANDFLQALFVRYTVLFVGCSMTDEEILGELVQSGSGARHHALVARGTPQVALFEALGTSATEYDCHMDTDGHVSDHYGLEKMLSRWARELNNMPATGARGIAR